MPERRNWSEQEVRAALAPYLCTDFGRIHIRDPDIIHLAALDESLPRSGMGNVSRTDRIVWDDFTANPEPLLQQWRRQQRPEPFAFPTGEGQVIEAREGAERPARVMQRVDQDFFRAMILTSYGNRCAVTGIDDARLLNASHIVGWKEEPRLRLNPSNGLCLNALHDRAFDRHLLTFDAEWRLVLSPTLPPEARRHLLRGASERLSLPQRFLPDQDLMELHRQRFRKIAA